MTPRERVLSETLETRDKAQALLDSLLQAKALCENHLADARRPDAVKNITGRSSLDAALASTRRMLDTLDRAVAEARRELTNDADTLIGAQLASADADLQPRPLPARPRIAPPCAPSCAPPFVGAVA